MDQEAYNKITEGVLSSFIASLYSKVCSPPCCFAAILNQPLTTYM